MATRVEKGVYYPLADEEHPTMAAARRVGNPKNLRAVWTGEFRPVKAGEWFLSGAIVEVYYSPAGTSASFHVAELVDIANTHWVVTKDGKPVAVCATENDAEVWLLKHQPMSNGWAKRYEGYAVTEVRGE